MIEIEQYLNIEAEEPAVDFEDQSFSATYNASMKDNEKWPPFPKAKYDAQQRKWRVGKDGRKPEHLAKAQ